MLIDTFDQLTSGERVSGIVFVDSKITVPSPGMRVRFAEDDDNADAWICHDETGIWLSSNAHETDESGYRGFGGFEEPLSTIREIVFALG